MPRLYLITGVDKGLGLELMKDVCRNGDWCVGICKTTEDCRRLESGECRECSDRCLILPADVRSESDVLRASEVFNRKVMQEKIWGDEPRKGFEVIISNASQYELPQGFLDATPSSLEEQFRVHVLGAFNVVRAFLPYTCKNPGCKFVIITSDHASNQLAKERNAPALGYAISEAANVQLMTQLAQMPKFDESFRHLTTFAVHPGFFESQLGRLAQREEGRQLEPVDKVGRELLQCVDRWNESGAFINRQGERLPF